VQNLTVGSPTRLILTFATPILLGAVFQQIYGFIDAAVVGQFLGVDGLAAIGAPAALIFLLTGLSWGGSAGLAIPVARAYGAGDMAGVRRFAAAGAYASVGIAAVITVVGVLFSRDILVMMNTPAEILDQSVTFVIVLLGGSAATVLLNFLVATVRALGDSRTPLYFLLGSSVLNAVLVVVLVGLVGMDVSGAAAATILAHLVTALLMLLVIRRRMPSLHLRRADWIAGRSSMREPLRTGIPMGLQLSAVAVGQIVLQVAVNGLGATTVAAFTAALRVDNFVVVPLMSFGVATVTYVAQNRGAHEWHRIRVGVLRTMLISSGAAVVVGLALMMAARPVVTWFVGGYEVEVLAMARTYFLVNGGLYALLAATFVLRNAVQGMGVSLAPTISGVTETIARAFAALVLVAPLGFVGVALAAPIGWLGALVPVVVSWFVQRRRLLRLEREALAALATVPGVAVPEVADALALALEGPVREPALV